MQAKETFQAYSKRVGIIAVNHTGYVETMFACMEDGIIAVPLRDADDRDRINAASIDKVVTPTAGKAWMARSFSSPNSDAIALISFTSGTEGSPKGVILTHKNLANVIERLNKLMQVDDSISEYIGVPVYHSFGFGRCRAVASAGGRFFIPNNGFNPSEIGEMLRKGEINAISAVPSLWRILLANKDLIGSYGKRVRWIEIGSQYMSRWEKEELKALFPSAIIVQHYGLTEASRTTLLEIHQQEGELLESVGQALGGVEVRLTQEGQIAIRGEHVADSYIIDGNKIKIPDDDGWLTTNDLGVIENGYLYYKGRADDVINCGGIKVHPEALETKIYARIGYGNGLAVCRKTDLMRGEGFLVAVTKDSGIDQQELREAVLQSIQEFGVNAANAITIIDVDSLPKTASGKIQRKKLVEWYEFQQMGEDEPIKADFLVDTPIQSIFCRILNQRQVLPENTFISLGGDSLSYTQISMELERYLGYLPQKWEEMPLRELEKQAVQRRSSTIIETSIFFRALAICGVVFNHAGFLSGLIGGGSFLLLVIAGVNFARFQGSALFQGRLIKAVFSLLQNLLIPYYVIALGYQAYKHMLFLPILELDSNFLGAANEPSIFPVWFIELLTQCIVLFSLLFNIRAVRKFANSSPWRFGLATLGVAVSSRLLVPYLWNTDYLYNRVPHMLFWLFTVGWCIHFAKSRPQKLIASIIVPILAFNFLGLNDSFMWWVIVGGMILIWKEYVSVPQIVKTPIQTVSAAAYYIYLTHMIWIYIVSHLAGIRDPLINAIFALLGGIITWSAQGLIKQFWYSINKHRLAV